MARKTSRRGGAWYDPRSWFAKSPEQKAKECADAKKKADEVCAGEASAADVPAVAQNTGPAPAAAPAATEGAARRRRRQTRRKYKAGKHRKGH